MIRIGEGTLESAWWEPGPAEAPTLVLLHEGLGCVALWRDFPARLAAATGWGVFAYSRFGYGGSDGTLLPRPMTYMHDEALGVLPEVLRAAGVKRAVLVGHSDGGSIAAIYAGSVGAACRPVLGGCPGQDVDGGRAEPGHDTMTAPALLGLIMIAAHFFVEDLNITSIRAIRTAYDTGTLRPRLGRYHRDVDTAFRGWSEAWLDPRFRDFDITGFLPRIDVPILALQGAADPYGSDEQLRVLEANVRVPIISRIIGGAKHSPHLEVADETLAAVTSFIATLPLGASK